MSRIFFQQLNRWWKQDDVNLTLLALAIHFKESCTTIRDALEVISVFKSMYYRIQQSDAVACVSWLLQAQNVSSSAVFTRNATL